MEGRVNKKVNDHQYNFKTDIQDYLKKNDLSIKNRDDQELTNDFLKFIFDNGNINFSKEDFKKRKRVKNQVPQYERCIACRANGQQCTRRRKNDFMYCGTHVKGTPHGELNSSVDDINKVKKIEVWVQEIKGINYYIDSDKNVYLPEDIISNSISPRVIGKWEIDKENNYSIPALDHYYTNNDKSN